MEILNLDEIIVDKKQILLGGVTIDINSQPTLYQALELTKIAKSFGDGKVDETNIEEIIKKLHSTYFSNKIDYKTFSESLTIESFTKLINFIMGNKGEEEVISKKN